MSETPPRSVTTTVDGCVYEARLESVHGGGDATYEVVLPETDVQAGYDFFTTTGPLDPETLQRLLAAYFAGHGDGVSRRHFQTGWLPDEEAGRIDLDYWKRRAERLEARLREAGVSFDE